MKKYIIVVLLLIVLPVYSQVIVEIPVECAWPCGKEIIKGNFGEIDSFLDTGTISQAEADIRYYNTTGDTLQGLMNTDNTRNTLYPVPSVRLPSVSVRIGQPSGSTSAASRSAKLKFIRL